MQASPTHAGHSSRWRSSSPEALRHGSTGAMAIRKSSDSPMGIVMRSKYGRPTEMRLPLTASTMSGKTVPSSTMKAKAANSTLLARKAPSRDSGESIDPGERSVSPRQPINPMHTMTVTPKNTRIGGTDRRLGEGVDGVEHARPGQERAEDRQAERCHQQRQVPDPEHPPTLLHHHRVEVGGAGQPRQERRVLDRVPRPEPAPPEHLVAPPRAEDDADGEEAPGEEGPPAGLHQPPLAEPTRDQRGDGEGERDGEPDVPEVEHRRVDRHQRVVLQQRVRPRTVGRDGADHGPERVGRSDHQARRRRPRRRRR